MELYSPQIRVSIGGYTFSKGVEIVFNSRDDTAFDWARIRFVSPFEQTVTIAPRDPADLQLGYNGQFETVFTGYATSGLTTGRDGNEVILKDGMLLLGDVRINNTFLQVTPQEIVSYAANQAGITKLALDDTPYPPAACLPIVNKTGLQAIRELSSRWCINPRLYFLGGVLHWGKADEQAEVYCFEYAKNIISLRLEGGLWELQTVSVPFVRHSQKIRVTHPKLSGEFTVCRVKVSTRGPGFIRTTLYFKGAAI